MKTPQLVKWPDLSGMWRRNLLKPKAVVKRANKKKHKK
jgi:hypothetical protein